MSRDHNESADSIKYNRLFILGGAELTEDEWRDTFGEFGAIEDVWIVTDRRTNENKGTPCFFSSHSLSHE